MTDDRTDAVGLLHDAANGGAVEAEFFSSAAAHSAHDKDGHAAGASSAATVRGAALNEAGTQLMISDGWQSVTSGGGQRTASRAGQGVTSDGW